MVVGGSLWAVPDAKHRPQLHRQPYIVVLKEAPYDLCDFGDALGAWRHRPLKLGGEREDCVVIKAAGHRGFVDDVVVGLQGGAHLEVVFQSICITSGAVAEGALVALVDIVALVAVRGATECGVALEPVLGDSVFGRIPSIKRRSVRRLRPAITKRFMHRFVISSACGTVVHVIIW